MSLLSYNELLRLVEAGVINAPKEHISGASIDITIGDEIMIERYCVGNFDSVDLQAKQSLDMIKCPLGEEGFPLKPGEFILATTRETFNLPNYIAAEYKLKSSLARSGLNHMLAGWCDPGWSNSKLTLELKNVTQHHTLLIKPGMKIGQMVFWECNPVPNEHSYAVKGQYNDQETVTENKGLQ